MATATRLLRLARSRVGDPYHLGAQVPKGNPEWHGPWDCAEFTSWCVFQATGTLFGCRPGNKGPDIADAYSGWWAEDAKKLGKEISVGAATATPGAFLLRVPQDGAIGHVVISVGDGTTIEAHSTKLGVIKGKVAGRRWHLGVLVPGIKVRSVTPAPPQRPGLVLRVKKPPMSGELVRSVQRRLTALGYHSGPADGEYGPQTAAAVQAFQSAKHLVVDGEVGKRTAAVLGVQWF